jgi:hypothetical protein
LLIFQGWVLTDVNPDTGIAEYTAGEILLVFFGIIIAIFSLGNAGPFIGNIAVARGAAYKVFEIIDRVSLLFVFVCILHLLKLEYLNQVRNFSYFILIK